MNFEELLVAALKRQGFGALDAEEIADWYLGMPETPFPANFRRAVLAANGYDPSQPRNADGEWTAGGGARHAATGKTDSGSHTPEQQKRARNLWDELIDLKVKPGLRNRLMGLGHMGALNDPIWTYIYKLRTGAAKKVRDRGAWLVKCLLNDKLKHYKNN